MESNANNTSTLSNSGAGQSETLTSQHGHIRSMREGRRVLIIDDDHDTVEAIKFIVESYSNSRCDRAFDAYEGLNALCESHYDFVMVDQKLPGLKGSTVLEKMDKYAEQDPLIAEAGHFSTKIPVVLMSGDEIRLPEGYGFKHFQLVDVIRKKDLTRFLGESFAS
jgi:CheY-like chemotaxis protein